MASLCQSKTFQRRWHSGPSTTVAVAPRPAALVVHQQASALSPRSAAGAKARLLDAPVHS
jgi:hypothetical protein